MVDGREPVLEQDGYPPAFVPAAYAWHPRRVGTLGPEVVQFAELIGHPCDAEQAADLDVLASFGPDGLYVASEAHMLEGRQNGKTDRTLLPWTLYDLFVGRARIVDWTAHLMDTTRKQKRIVDQLIEGSPMLSRRVKRIIDARDSEGFVLHRLPGENGEREWHWATRSQGAGRGGPADVWVADEFLFVTGAMLGARMPTLRSRRGAQLRGASSAGLRRSGPLRKVVARGRAGGDPALAYVERCAPGGFDGSECADGAGCSHVYGVAEGCALDREDRWHLANHALARGRMRYATLRSERVSLPAVEFGREAAGWHEPGEDDEGTVDVEVWDRFADRTSRVAEGQRPAVLVVGVREDGDGAVAVAGPRDDGRLHLALIRDGIAPGQALADEVLELRKRHKPRTVLVLDGPATRTTAVLLKARTRVQMVSGPDRAAAAADLLAGIRADDFRHRGDRIVRASLEASPPRKTSDGGWQWDARAGAEVVPILLVTVARWAASQTKTYDPTRSFG